MPEQSNIRWLYPRLKGKPKATALRLKKRKHFELIPQRKRKRFEPIPPLNVTFSNKEIDAFIKKWEMRKIEKKIKKHKVDL